MNRWFRFPFLVFVGFVGRRGAEGTKAEWFGGDSRKKFGGPTSSCHTTDVFRKPQTLRKNFVRRANFLFENEKMNSCLTWHSEINKMERSDVLTFRPLCFLSRRCAFHSKLKDKKIISAHSTAK